MTIEQVEQILNERQEAYDSLFYYHGGARKDHTSMNYQTVSKQQLLAERARLQAVHRKAEQRLATGMRPNALGGGTSRPGKGSSRTPQRELDQIAAQLARVEAELEQRNQASDLSPAPRSPPSTNLRQARGYVCQGQSKCQSPQR